MNKLCVYLSVILLFVLTGFLTNCKTDDPSVEIQTPPVSTQDLVGHAQKGPFINGSSVTVYDLQTDLSPTGKSYNTQITDNKGTFEFNHIALSSNYIILKADGFYFNEISGKQSSASITLYALSDTTAKNDINVNVLTHLEKPRVEYLMKNGKSFAESKKQAQKEILAIFNMEKSDMLTSENLTISGSGEDNGILLAISAIVQGNRPESEMTELLSNIGNDIKEDGILNSETVGSALINHAIVLDPTAIKENLTARYTSTGTTVTVADFGKYIDNFILKTNFIASPPPITTHDIVGYAQKGPFINGSAVTIYDLKSDLSATGKSFNAQITDNKGTFELNNVSLSSDYIGLRADGFYFNEISGKQSDAQITLYALSDITGKSDINVNILTHLEKSRVEYLIKNGKSFAESKMQAQKEILAIFNIEKSDIQSAENLNISKSGDDNAILLAISAILQGYRSESEMTELLSNISNDIKEDGILNSETLGSALINHAIILDAGSIKSNLTRRYGEIGITVNIPDFEKYITGFISKTRFVVTKSLISYPETGLNGANLLSLSKTTYPSGMGTSLSLAAQLAKGSALKIKITSMSADTTTINPTDTTQVQIIVRKAQWFYALGTGINWSITNFDTNNYTQTFTALEPDKSCDLNMFFEKGTFKIEYFEMNATVPTRTKTITCN